MKILFVIPSLTQGGAEKVFIWLANTLSASFNIVFVTLTNQANLQSEKLNQHISKYEINANKSIQSSLQLRNIIKKESPHIVISTIVTANFVSTLSIAFLKNKPFHILRISNNLKYIKTSSVKNRLMINISNLFSDKVIVLSDDNFESVQNDIFLSSNKIKKIENPVIITNRDKQRNISNNILCISRIEPHKNLDFLINNLIELSSSQKFSIDIFGEGSQLAKYREVYSQYDFITFKGYISKEEINYDNYGIFINCSDFEGSPNSTNEALAEGMLCLVSDNLSKTLPTYLQHLPYIFEKGNINDFCNKIKILFSITENDNLEIEPNEEEVLSLWHEVLEGLPG